MKELFSILTEKCEAGELYGSDYLPANLALFEQFNVAVVITGADGQSYITSSVDSDLLINQLNYSLLSNDANNELIKTTENYKIFKQKFPELEDTFLVLIGVLPDGNIVFIKATASALEQTASITNKFFLTMVLLDSILSVIVGRYFIAKLTKPLFELINITKRISNFDFEATYHPQRMYNEMDDLGEHVNEMSTTLKRAIEQLRLANDNLKHDLELKEETENMRKEFVSNVSHELKTPIALIQGYAEGLQEGIMDDEVSRQIYLDIIIDEANKMNRLVREMLILNQLEAGQMNLDMVDFNVTEMIDSVIDSNRIYFEAQNISFTFIDKQDCYVHADEFLVEQVVTNFVSNAIHYVLNENIVTVRYDFVKRGKVRIIVFNSGNNIGKRDIKHIWEKFYKADKARSREYGGSGIGLSVVKATMELLHEKFGVENVPDGVEFWFELSLAKDTKIKENS
jgi:signal transduction histidine kinase